MAGENDNANNPVLEQVNNDAGTGNAPAFDPNQFVPADEFKKLEQTVAGFAGQFEQMNANLSTLIASNQRTNDPPASVPAQPELTDEEVEEALLAGKGGPAVRRMLSSAIAQNNEKLIKEIIEPIRMQGFNALSSMARTTLSAKPHYARYKKEIDAHLGSLPLEYRSQPEILEFAYNAVVGQHFDELQAETREEALRSNTTTKADTTGNAPGRTAPGEPSIPTVEEVCGPEAAAALAQKNQSPDQFAQRLGYENWAAYAKVAVGAEETAGAAS